MFTTEESKRFTACADNLERLAANGIAEACSFLSKMENNDLSRFKQWAEIHHDACFQFIEDYEKGIIGVKSSHIFWN